jgi:hypothetical protein
MAAGDEEFILSIEEEVGGTAVVATMLAGGGGGGGGDFGSAKVVAKVVVPDGCWAAAARFDTISLALDLRNNRRSLDS